MTAEKAWPLSVAEWAGEPDMKGIALPCMMEKDVGAGASTYGTAEGVGGNGAAPIVSAGLGGGEPGSRPGRLPANAPGSTRGAGDVAAGRSHSAAVTPAGWVLGPLVAAGGCEAVEPEVHSSCGAVLPPAV